MVGALYESIPHGLKPGLLAGCEAKAKALAYLEAKAKTPLS